MRAFAGRVARTLPARIFLGFIEDDGPNWATVIAWNALTAVFPVALGIIAIAGFVLAAAGVGTFQVIQRVVVLFPNDPTTQQAAVEGIRAAQKSAWLFAVFALVGYLWTASNLFGAMEAAFDAVFHCGRRDIVPQKLMALGMMAIFSVFALLAVGTSALLPVLSQLPDMPRSVTRWSTFPIQFLVGAASGFLLYFAVYFVVPNRRQPLIQIWPGALLAGVGFELLTLIFPLYISLNPGINQFGKSFALLFVLVTFFFFLGVITMLGAELNALVGPPARVALPLPGRALAHVPRVLPRPVRTGRLRWPRRALLAVVAAGIGLFAASRRPGGDR